MMKHELVHHRRYSTREQARREIMEYIEVFYNRPAAAFPAEESLNLLGDWLRDALNPRLRR